MRYKATKIAPIDQKGFTLLEVLIAFIITTISVATILNAFSMSHRLSLKGAEEKEVARIAEFLLASLDSDPYFLQDMKAVSGTVEGDEEPWTYSVEFNDVVIEGFTQKEDNKEYPKEMTLHIISPLTKKDYIFTTWVLHSPKTAANRKAGKTSGKKDSSSGSKLKGRRGL